MNEDVFPTQPQPHPFLSSVLLPRGQPSTSRRSFRQDIVDTKARASASGPVENLSHLFPHEASQCQGTLLMVTKAEEANEHNDEHGEVRYK